MLVAGETVGWGGGCWLACRCGSPKATTWAGLFYSLGWRQYLSRHAGPCGSLRWDPSQQNRQELLAYSGGQHSQEGGTLGLSQTLLFLQPTKRAGNPDG